MTIEYIELKKDNANVFWNTEKPTMYLDENMRIALPDSSYYNYKEITQSIEKHKRYSLTSLNKKNLFLEFMPFASRKLRDYLDNNNTTHSKVPLITDYLGNYYIYISHKNYGALLKVSNEEVTNEFLDIIDNIYEIS